MITNCPVCGKLTCIHWPEHWVYRRGSAYYCSDLCMDAAMVKDMNAINEAVKRRKELAMTKITLEQKKKAVELAIIGENPLPYLKKCGSNAPDKTWYAIKAALKEKDPETYAKIPDFRGKTMTANEPKTAGDAMVAMKEAADNFFSQCEDMGLKMETPTVKVDGPIRIETKEPEKIELVGRDYDIVAMDKELKFNERTTVTAIRVEGLGEFYFDKKYNSVDWRAESGDEVSLGPAWWIQLVEDLPLILKKLGVES